MIIIKMSGIDHILKKRILTHKKILNSTADAFQHEFNNAADVC